MKALHILLLVASCALSACGRGVTNAANDAAWEEEQKRTRKQMDDYDRQTRHVDELQTKQYEQNRRFDALLNKWEEQSRRQDAILDAMEKQHGIKN